MNKTQPFLILMRSVTAALCLFAIAQPALAQDAAKVPRKDLALKGDAVCTRCHGVDDEYPVLAIGQTKHGTVADKRTPTCTSCHGASETHINRPADAKERPKPTITYGLPPPRQDAKQVDVYFGVAGKKTDTPAADRNAACLTCHQGGKRTHWETSLHASRDTTCTSCHQIHTAHDKVRDKRDQAQVCYTCHKEQRAQNQRPSRHPIPEGKMTCSDCHNPHGSAGTKNMVRDSVNETCYTCHMEKRGPFVRSHQPVQEDCSICHNPHGTPTPNLLKARPPFLCQECHEPTGHRGGPGIFTTPGTSTSSANLVARGCVNCHTNIHGTNNPTSASGGRSLRR